MVDESGTKLDKIVISCEMMHLPASMIDLYEESLKQQRFLKSFFADNAVYFPSRTCARPRNKYYCACFPPPSAYDKKICRVT